MNLYENLKFSENLLEGGWEVRNGSIIEDRVSQRINFLVKDILKKVATSSDGWCVLYMDPADGRFWELTYPNGEQQGGGAPFLKCLDRDSVEQRYKV